MRKHLRIALVSETCFPQINGVSRTLEQLTGSLRSAGEEVQLICPRYPKAAPARKGLPTRSFPSLPLPFYPEVRQPLVWPALLRRTLRRCAPDIVHIATEGVLGYSALKAALSLELPVVTSYHTNFPQYLKSYGMGWLAPAALGYLRRFHNAGLLTWCPTPGIARQLSEQGFENLEIWSRGVNSEAFHPRFRNSETRRNLDLDPQDRVLVYSGRLAAEKNLSMLIEAFEGLDEPGLKLLLIGDGPLRGALERRGNPNLRFTGFLRGEELSCALACGDLLVFPSLTDTFGNVILEAMACGVPALGFRVCGPRDIILRGLSGDLADEIGSASLARAIRRLLAQPEQLRQMGVRARIYAEDQSWQKVNQVVLDGYRQAVERFGSRRHPAHPPRTLPLWDEGRPEKLNLC